MQEGRKEGRKISILRSASASISHLKMAVKKFFLDKRKDRKTEGNCRHGSSNSSLDYRFLTNETNSYQNLSEYQPCILQSYTAHVNTKTHACIADA